MAQALLIGVLCDDKQIGPHHFHSVGDKYVRAVTDAMGAIPLLIPVLAQAFDIKDVLSRVDGLLLPGSYSNIDPMHYGQDNQEQDPLRDPARDATAFAAIKEAARIGLPVFAICRGFQEVNVAFGGTLHQKVQEVDGLNDHREDKDISLDAQYADVHTIHLTEGGLLATKSGKPQVMVNSLHQQGIKDLAENMKVEALAEDGLIEAFSSKSEDQFLIAAQWHPEYQVTENPFNLSLFEMFKEACETYRSRNKS